MGGEIIGLLNKKSHPISSIDFLPELLYNHGMVLKDIILIVAASLLILVGLVGCIIPGLPGTPLCWTALLLGFFTSRSSLTVLMLIVFGILTVIVEILNNFVPAMFTKKAGGSKAGSIGSTVGVFVGLFMGSIVTILLGPFVGALVGELIHDHKNMDRAVKSAAFSFLGFLSGSGIRLITSAVMVIFFVKSFFNG